MIDRVVRRDLVNLRRAVFLRGRGIGDRRQHAVVDLDLLGGVAWLARNVSAMTTATSIADMAGLAVASAGCGAAFIGEPSLE